MCVTTLVLLNLTKVAFQMFTCYRKSHINQMISSYKKSFVHICIWRHPLHYYIRSTRWRQIGVFPNDFSKNKTKQKFQVVHVKNVRICTEFSDIILMQYFCSPFNMELKCLLTLTILQNPRTAENNLIFI